MATAEDACLREWRRALLKSASGYVLEVGAGTGANLNFYTSAVSKLVLSEPDAHMRRQLHRKIDECGAINVDVKNRSVEHIEDEDNTYDYVVATLVFCSVDNLAKGLDEVRRVLKPGGKLLFMEHVAAQAGTRRRRWQQWINPIWKRVNSNCHLNRETEQAIVEADFSIESVERESMRKAMPIVRPTIRGLAVKDPSVDIRSG